MELHSTAKIDALSDSWDEDETGVTLNVYELRFTSRSNNDKTYSNFAFLMKSELDDDITNTEIDLFVTTDKIVNSEFLPRGQMTLDLTQMKNAKDFQEIIFNGIFGNLRNKKKFTEKKNLWCSSYMYLILPLESDKSGVSVIDWKCIETCASRAREFKSLSTISEEDYSTIDIDNIKEAPMGGTIHLHSQGESQILILASGICESSNLISKAVLTVHNGMLYQVVEIIHEKTAESPFPLKKDTQQRYDNYSQYFEKRHGKKLEYSNQPLLRVKHAKQPRNFLTKHQVQPVENEGTFVELPPELCLNLDVSSSVMKSLCLVPSVMRRLISLMLASQLNKTIREERPECPPVSLQLIMEAITSHKCLECYSYERLELLGDSFLKYATSLHLFMKYENGDEGELSSRRAVAVCNKTLHGLALHRNLQGYIIDEQFDVRKWVAPGLFCRSIVPCSCNLEDPNSLQTGKVCDKGHRWIHSKTISDVLEALIGAHLIGGGTKAALEFMRWMNIEVDIEDKSIDIACNRSFDYPSALETNLDELQSLLDYQFKNKHLLVEALTHASANGGCSYQRSEFLGDSVLDLLITQHLYSTYQESSQGTLSDLRQVLGDILESISGAILVDTQLELDIVWEKIKPILSPSTGKNKTIELQPVRELRELCDQQHYNYSSDITKKENVSVATVQIQIEICGEGSDTNKKSAQIKAAKHALAQLKAMGIYHDRHTHVQSSMDATGNEAPHGSNLIAQEKMIIARSPHGDIESDRPKKRTKARKISVNSLIPEDHIGDGKDVPITHNSGGGLIITNEDVERNHPKKRAKKECSLPGLYSKLR
ncbi:hypothetical protein SUGI_0631970 [Cryptomeria japonica]|nr:hypothetical protein SUGI_0631970 [Cryptomeria japonica]